MGDLNETKKARGLGNLEWCLGFKERLEGRVR